MRPSPRIFIYLIAIIACAWLMHRTSSRPQQQSASPDASPSARLAPVAKDAELSSPSATRRPLLIILSADESTLPNDALRARLQEFCQVIHLQTNADAQRHFRADKVPVAILFNRESEEISRLQYPWEEEDLLALAKKATPKNDQQ